MKTNEGYLDALGRECHPDLSKQSDMSVDLTAPPSSVEQMIREMVNAALFQRDSRQTSAVEGSDDDLDWDDDPDYSTMSQHSLDLQEAALNVELEKIAAARASSVNHTSQGDSPASPPTNEAAASAAVPAAGAAEKPDVPASKKQ